MARISTYLNFAGKTEEAFNFYRTVFRTEFAGPIARFSEAPAHPDHPLSAAEQQLVLHIELPTLGGHVLMGTDAVESMGMRITTGNNMHLNLEPDTRDEAKRLFDALADGGTIRMPLQDMFWGAYFGSLVDRYGINWMVNCATPK